MSKLESSLLVLLAIERHPVWRFEDPMAICVFKRYFIDHEPERKRSFDHRIILISDVNALRVSNDAFEQLKQPCKADWLLELFELLRFGVLVV